MIETIFWLALALLSLLYVIYDSLFGKTVWDRIRESVNKDKDGQLEEIRKQYEGLDK